MLAGRPASIKFLILAFAGRPASTKFFVLAFAGCPASIKFFVLAFAGRPASIKSQGGDPFLQPQRTTAIFVTTPSLPSGVEARTR